MTARTRVLVVDDSLTVRKRIVEVLSSQPDFAVVGEAGDGKAAIELCERLRPDVITLDMVLPVMSGLAVTEYVMAYCPTPILVVSASMNRGELFKTYDALAAGAIDVLDKPGRNVDDGGWEARFVSTVRTVSRVKAITHPRARLGGLGRVSPPVRGVSASERRIATRAEVAAIGGSTGCPGVLVEILGRLPRGFAGTVLLVVHINEPFGTVFAEWLGNESGTPVRIARSGERVSAARGTVLMARPDRHLVVRDGVIDLAAGPERNSCRPSIDVLFESLAREPYAHAVVACLLTGMGRDGAQGMLALRNAGAFTIAQDETTCAIYGMPREAVLLGGVNRTLAPGEIGAELAEMMSPREGTR